MSNSINSAVKSGHGNAVIVAGFLGLVLSDIIPTPGDALYFHRQQVLKSKLEKKEITPKQYWIKDATGYYLYNSVWWALVFGVVMLSKGSFDQKLKLGIALSGTGVVIGVLAKNIKKDNNERING